jgi:hypothetical protein
LFLTSYEALNAFSKQLERNIGGKSFHTKVIVTPSSINEKGVVIKVSPLKTVIQTRTPAAHGSRTLRLRVSVAGTAESMTGLKQALEAIEAVDRYLASPNLRLETQDGQGVANSRIIQEINGEDSFFDSPDSTSVQDVQDDRIVTITIPEGGN